MQYQQDFSVNGLQRHLTGSVALMVLFQISTSSGGIQHQGKACFCMDLWHSQQPSFGRVVY